MDIQAISNLSECEKLWKKFRRDTNIWTDWEIVMSFFDAKLHRPHFILMKENGKEIGLIPLWLDLRDNKYTHFGGERMECRTFWVDKNYYKEIERCIPEDTYMFDMDANQIAEINAANPEMEKIAHDMDTRFYLNLENIGELDNYLERFGKKHKKNLLRDLKILQSTNYKLKWVHSNHIEKFVELSKARFEEESDFNDEENQKEMSRFTSLCEKKNLLHTLLIEIDGKIEGAELAVFFEGHYYVINGGYNPNIKNLGKLLIIEHIRKSIELKAKEIDFLVGDSGWKELWNLDKQEVCSVIKLKK